MKGLNDLVENDFLIVSEEYMMLAYDEERKGAGHAPCGEELGGADDEAFHRARAKAKVQSLRTRRLERQQVEDLESRLAEKQ